MENKWASVPRVGCHPSPRRVYMEALKRLNYPCLITRDTSPSKVNLEVFRFSPLNECLATATCLASTQALRSRRVSSASKLLGGSDLGGQSPPGKLDRPGGQTAPPRRLERPKRFDRPSSAVEPASVAACPRRVFGLGSVAQPSNPVVFWWTTANLTNSV
jgi:hypothetical protein